MYKSRAASVSTCVYFVLLLSPPASASSLPQRLKGLANGECVGECVTKYIGKCVCVRVKTDLVLMANLPVFPRHLAMANRQFCKDIATCIYTQNKRKNADTSGCVCLCMPGRVCFFIARSLCVYISLPPQFTIAKTRLVLMARSLVSPRNLAVANRQFCKDIATLNSTSMSKTKEKMQTYMCPIAVDR